MDDFRVQLSYDFSQGKKQDIAVKVLTDYAERAGGARGLEK